jgi:hypothetical protein
MSTAAAASPAGEAIAPEPSEPNQYHLSGDGITVSYYPEGIGPVVEGQGAICFVYQDANLLRSFTRDEVREIESPDTGRIVSVTLRESIDAGSVTFSLLVPAVRLTAGAGAPVRTLAVTTVHRTFLIGPGPGQQETYSVAELNGDARDGILPMTVKAN